jgi:hypothetical protein
VLVHPRQDHKNYEMEFGTKEKGDTSCTNKRDQEEEIYGHYKHKHFGHTPMGHILLHVGTRSNHANRTTLVHLDLYFSTIFSKNIIEIYSIHHFKNIFLFKKI